MITIYIGDWIDRLAGLPDKFANCVVTSPPYWGLRDYDMDRQVGAEATMYEYVDQLVAGFREVRRVLTDNGTVWLNLGDAYAGSGRGKWNDSEKKRNAKIKERYIPDSSSVHTSNVPAGLKRKDLMGIPYRVALALQDDGWYWRSEVIWHKPAAKPENVKDRPSRDYEPVFLFSKRDRYFFNRLTEPAIGGGERGMRTVWSIPTRVSWFGHMAVFPVELPRRCISFSCPPNGVVLDPFAGEGTTMLAAEEAGLDSIGIELNPDYARRSAIKLKEMLCQVEVIE